MKNPGKKRPELEIICVSLWFNKAESILNYLNAECLLKVGSLLLLNAYECWIELRQICIVTIEKLTESNDLSL